MLTYFSNVQEIDCRTIEWNRLQYNRNNASYRLLINICYLVVKGMLLADTKDFG